jgi:hypothetical protein
MHSESTGFCALVGVTLQAIGGLGKGSDRVVFEANDGRSWVMRHGRECCETVEVEDVIGDVDDLVGSPIVEASETSQKAERDEWNESSTWTFYRLSTVKGTVTIRWLGQSNGYYSEAVDFEEVIT